MSLWGQERIENCFELKCDMIAIPSPVIASAIDRVELGEFRSTPNKYKYIVQLGMIFYANDAQLDDAKKEADLLLRRRVFGPLMEHVYEIRHAIMCGDKAGAMQEIRAIEALVGER